MDTSLAHLRVSVAWARVAPTPLADMEARLRSVAAAFDADESWGFTMLDATEQHVLGGSAVEPAEAALTALVGPGALETGYWLRASATGHGYATEAIAALAKLAFRNASVRHMVICHDPANTASAGIPRRLGFRSIGVVADAVLPGRLAADGSVRPATAVWVLDAVAPNEAL